MKRVARVLDHLQPPVPLTDAGDIRRNATGASKRFTKEELEELNDSGEVLIVINGNVYDVKEFLPEHPGGGEIITDVEDWCVNAFHWPSPL